MQQQQQQTDDYAGGKAAFLLPNGCHVQYTEVSQAVHGGSHNTFTEVRNTIRIVNSIGAFLAVTVGGFIALNTINLSIVMAALVAFLISAFGFAINSYYDRKLDLAAEKGPFLSLETTKRVAIITVIGGLGSVLLLQNLLTITIAFATAGLLFAYSWKVKAWHAAIANLITAYGTAVTFLFGWSVSALPTPWSLTFSYDTNIFLTVCVISATVFFAALSREFVKGIADISGDRKAGLKTYALLKGPKTASYSALVLAVVATLFATLPTLLDVFSQTYLPLIFAISTLILSTTLILYLKTPTGMTLPESVEHKVASNADLAKAQYLWFMLGGIVVFGLGRLMPSDSYAFLGLGFALIPISVLSTRRALGLLSRIGAIA